MKQKKNPSTTSIRQCIVVCAGILLLSIVLGTALMCLVYALPVNLMKENAARSSALFDYEGVYPQLMTGYKSSQLDNCTDAIMIGNAIDPGEGESIVRRAMINQRIEYRGVNPVQSLNDYANDVASKEDSIFYPGYARYWHGYLVILKPLLLVFDYADIRCLNMILQVCLMGWLGMLMVSGGYKRLAVSLGITILFLNPAAIMLSLQYSSVFYLMLAASIILMKYKAYFTLSDNHYVYLFFVTGVLTGFLDFLTYPAVTLGIPLLIFLALREGDMLKAKVRGIIRAAVFWGTGYGFMWAGKWLVSSILLKSNMFSDAIRTILFRASMETEGESITWLQVVWRNLRVLVKWPYLLLTAAVFVVILINIRRSGRSCKRKLLRERALPYLLIALIPFVWYFFMGNHSYEHYWFTFRELGITCFAFFAYILSIPEKFNRSQEKPLIPGGK